ncbi:MAG TPA: four helix bundle protein [Verrucomicrobiae bacterium]|nr:four helix bundle protein [Verrucomicrobiae bacterium]
MKNADPGSGGPGKSQSKDIPGRTFEFAARVIQFSGKLDERRGVGRVRMGRVVRAGTSSASNGEEAPAAQSKPDCIGKMSRAPKEASETRLRLLLVSTAHPAPENQWRPLIPAADEIKRVIGANVVFSQRNRGWNF